MAGEVSEERQYFGNVLNSFENGVQLDLRVKLAVEFLKSGAIDLTSPIGQVDAGAEAAAKRALDLSSALLAEAGARGFLKDMPDDDELSQPLRRHLRRNVRAQVYSQVVSQRISNERGAADFTRGRGGGLEQAHVLNYE